MGNEIHKVLIIGSGPAGLTAAIYTARANLKPLVIAGKSPGGQLMLTSEVENFPGFPDGITGPDLMEAMIKQAKRFEAQLNYDDVTEVDFSKQPLTIKTASETYQAQSVIIATGSSARWLGLESETKLRGKGVSACATCDGAFFKEKKVFVVGGGDSAMEEATFLTKFASSVTVIVRKDTLKASQIMKDKANNNPKIDFIWNSQVEEVLGDTTMTGLKVKNTQTNETQELEGQGLFVAIGHKPNTDIFKGSLDLDKVGYIEVIEGTQTKIPGVFVAGDVFDYKYRQAITAAGSGCKAAIDAEKFLLHQE